MEYQGLIITSNDIKIAKDKELIHNSLERLLFSETLSNIGFLDKGSRILDYLHERVTFNEVIAIIREIKDLIRSYEPRIILDSVGAKIIPNESIIMIEVYLEFHFVDTPEEREIVAISKIKEV